MRQTETKRPRKKPTKMKVPYTGTPRTSPVKIARIQARKLMGEPVRKIAAAEGVCLNTVVRILSQQEASALIREYQSTIIERILRKAIKGLEELVEEKDRAAIIQVLYGTRTLLQRHDVAANTPEGPRDYSYSMAEFYIRHGRWPTLEEAKEFEKTPEIVPLTKGELVTCPISQSKRPTASVTDTTLRLLAERLGHPSESARVPTKCACTIRPST